jgi:NADPH-dependent 2,4-dienoyl-CoA reductase/sulfur reductase-like enzyme
VHVLRTLDDARALRAELLPGARLAVIGAGFIGSEVAATATALGVGVTVIEAASSPLAEALGSEMAAAVSSLHAAHGVDLHCGVAVTALVGTERVSGVALADGRVIAADVVVVGIGVRPNTDWLLGSGLEVSNGIICDPHGATNLPNVVAVGDCATWYDPSLRTHHRLEHWTGARERGAIAAATLLSGGTEQRTGRPPYFWSDQYGLTIQLAGQVRDADSVRVEEGAVADHDFLAVYRRGDDPVAVLAIGHGKSFMRWRRLLAEATVSTAAPGE